MIIMYVWLNVQLHIHNTSPFICFYHDKAIIPFIIPNRCISDLFRTLPGILIIYFDNYALLLGTLLLIKRNLMA